MFLSSFKLGRPGSEYEFEYNPEGMAIDEMPIASLQRNLAGDLKKSVIKNSAPTIRVNSNFLSPTQRDQFASLVGITDTFLSFITNDEDGPWQMFSERNKVTDLSHVTIQNNSATKLSQKLVEAGASGIITILGVAQVPNVVAGPVFGGGGFGEGGFSGPDFFTGGSYNDLTRVVTLGTALPAGTEYVYVSYSYTGWLVNMERLAHSARGGWVDRFMYDFALTGA